MRTNISYRFALCALPAALLLAGCNSKPGDSDVQAALAAVYECQALEVRDVKKLNGEPGPEGTYEVAFDYTVAFKGGEAGAAKILGDWVHLNKESDAARQARIDVERQSSKDDPRVQTLDAYVKQVDASMEQLVCGDNKEQVAVAVPLFKEGSEALKAGSGMVALPTGVRIVRTGLLSKSENGWYFRQLAVGFNSFDILQGRPTVFALPPSKVPTLLNAQASATGERTLTGIVHARLTDSCFTVTVDSAETCYAFPADPEQARRILSACGDGDRCSVTGKFDMQAESLGSVSKAVLAQ